MSIKDPERYQLVLNSINYRFGILEELIRVVAEGDLYGLLVRGEPGIGKTHTVFNVLDGYEESHDIVKITGKITPLQLYIKFFEHPDHQSIIVFDDADDSFQELGCLNILKAAVDTKPRRVITWASTSTKVPVPYFEFFGKVVIVTNADLRINVHYNALLDRMFNMNLSLNPEERLVKIVDIASRYTDVDLEITNLVVDWIERNYEVLAEQLSLRTFVNTVTLAKFSNRWQELALYTVFNGGLE